MNSVLRQRATCQAPAIPRLAKTFVPAASLGRISPQNPVHHDIDESTEIKTHENPGRKKSLPNFEPNSLLFKSTVIIYDEKSPGIVFYARKDSS